MSDKPYVVGRISLGVLQGSPPRRPVPVDATFIGAEEKAPCACEWCKGRAERLEEESAYRLKLLRAAEEEVSRLRAEVERLRLAPRQ